MMPEMMIGQVFICRENCVICHSEKAVSARPAAMIMRGSKRDTSRPTTIMATMVPAPRGAVTRPVNTTG